MTSSSFFLRETLVCVTPPPPLMWCSCTMHVCVAMHGVRSLIYNTCHSCSYPKETWLRGDLEASHYLTTPYLHHLGPLTSILALELELFNTYTRRGSIELWRGSLCWEGWPHPCYTPAGPIIIVEVMMLISLSITSMYVPWLRSRNTQL